jgi:Flp pilus assembly protein TadD/4-amino-4-deoxy-L-arabinose transferase-like glycosyltransferase
MARPRPSRRTIPERPDRSTLWLRLAAFLLATFLIKLVVVWQLADHVLLQPGNVMDSNAYFELAKRVVGGDWLLGPGLYYVSPLYIYFLALVFGSTGSLTAIRVVQVLLGTVSVGCIFFSAREWFGERAGWIAAGLAAATGLFTFYEVVLLQSSLDAVLTSATLLFFTLALTRDRMRWYALAGATMAVQSLNRPNVILVAAAMLVGLLLVRRLRAVGWVLAGLALALAPVTIRNVVAGEPSVLSSQGGLNFYIGNNATSTGFYAKPQGVSPTIEGQRTDTRVVAEAALNRKLSDTEVSNYFFGLGLSWIKQHPKDWLRLFAYKVFFLLNSQHTSLPLSYPFYAYDVKTLLRFLFVGAWLLTPLGVAGFVVGAFTFTGARRQAFLLWLTYTPAYFLSVAIFFVADRYRLPLLVPYAVGSGAAVDFLLRQWTARSAPMREFASVGAAVVVFGLAANWPLGIRDGDGRAEEQVHMAEVEARLGHVDQAEYWLNRALPSSTLVGMSHYRVGLQYVNASLYDRAIVHLEIALRDTPGEAHAEFMLGQALANLGRVKEAIPHLQRAADAHMTDIDLAGYDLAVAMMQTGDLAGAARVLRGVTPSPTTTIDSLMDLGQFGLKINAPDAAEPFFRRAVELAPTSPQTHDLYGVSLIMQKKYADARLQFTTALGLNGKDAEAASNLAFIEVQTGFLADARTHVDLALALDPGNELAKQVQGALAKLGK